MESIFGMENMGKDAAYVRVQQVYEKEILEVARISNITHQSGRNHPAWYGPIMAHLGDVLVSSGMRLKSYYSIQHASSVR